MKYIDADRLREELQKPKTELKVGNYYLDNSEQAVGYENALIDFELLIDSLQQEQPSLPSNLDEAEFEYAQSLDGIPANQEEDKMIYDAFKAGAKWRDAQIQKLPNNLDEAAKKKARDIFESLEKHDIGEEKNRVLFGLLELEALALTFSHFGSEWMARQGSSFNVNVEEVPQGHWYAGLHLGGCAEEEENALKSINAKDGEEVIVQIRKK